MLLVEAGKEGARPGAAKRSSGKAGGALREQNGVEEPFSLSLCSSGWCREIPRGMSKGRCWCCSAGRVGDVFRGRKGLCAGVGYGWVKWDRAGRAERRMRWDGSRTPQATGDSAAPFREARRAMRVGVRWGKAELGWGANGWLGQSWGSRTGGRGNSRAWHGKAASAKSRRAKWDMRGSAGRHTLRLRRVGQQAAAGWSSLKHAEVGWGSRRPRERRLAWLPWSVPSVSSLLSLPHHLLLPPLPPPPPPLHRWLTGSTSLLPARTPAAWPRAVEAAAAPHSRPDQPSNRPTHRQTGRTTDSKHRTRSQVKRDSATEQQPYIGQNRPQADSRPREPASRLTYTSRPRPLVGRTTGFG